MRDPLGLGHSMFDLRRQGAATEHIVVQRLLRRILAFTGRSIDDVVNSDVTKREVLGYFKLSRQIDRAAEVTDLERQWNRVS